MVDRSLSVRVSGKNIDIGEALRQQAEDRIKDAVGKYFDGGFSSRVTVEREGSGFRTDCVVHLDTGAIMTVAASTHDAYEGLRQIVERIAKQLRRDKRRRSDHAPRGLDERGPVRAIESEIDLDNAVNDDVQSIEVPEDVDYAKPIIAETRKQLDEVSVDEAIGRLEQGRLNHYVFLNRGTGRINIVHQRHDGAIGWVDVTPA